MASTLRFYLTGRVVVEGDRLVDQRALPGRQGRLALVHLVVNRHRPVPVEELAAALWGDVLPRSWEPSLRALTSKLRATVAAAAPVELRRDGGCFQLGLPPDAWVDVEAATNALDRAEGARRRGDHEAAWGDASVASTIARRPLLPGEDQPFVRDLRVRLEQVAVRALDVLTTTYLARGDHRLAAGTARELVALAPFREAGYRHLIRAEVADGDRAEALRTYEQLCRLLADELGVDPDPRTKRLLHETLGP